MAEMKITMDNYEAEVAQADGVVVLDFWAEWCGPCKAFGPIFEEFSKAYEGKVKTGKVNVDEENELARKFRVMTIPTTLVLKNGEALDRASGLLALEDVEAMVKKHL